MLRISRCGRGPLVAALTFALLASLLASPAAAYDPKHPKVQGIMEKAVTYLEKNDPQRNALWQNTMGFRMMIAYAIYKHRKNKQHPKVQEAIKLAKEQLAKDTLSEKRVYEIGTAISFLTDLGDPDSLALASALYDKMMEEQKEYGGWAYDGGSGDTSLMQYAMLGMWSAKNSEMEVNFDQARLEAATNWLLRTQAPGGNWGYRGNDPGNFNRVNQDITPSLAMFAAGAGSLYIAADLLGLRKERQPGGQGSSPFTAVQQPKQRKPGLKPNRVDKQRMWDSLALADRYWGGNGRLDAGKWQFYYMYAQERYMTFRNEVQGLNEPKTGPDWYNAGVDYLGKVQGRDGSFSSPENNSGPMIDTALAVLFLVRSTKTKLHPPTSGVALGGLGIPDNYQIARQTADGKVVAPEKKNDIEDLGKMIEMLEAEGTFQGEVPNISDSLIKKPIEKSQLEVLRDKVANEPSYQKRLIAVRLLAGGGMDNAPVLIFALSDPDHNVSRSARDSLRLMSRKVSGFGMPDLANVQQKKDAQRKWSTWLRRVRPDLEF